MSQKIIKGLSEYDARFIITCGGTPVAWFFHESDRDFCFDHLNDAYEDCEWGKETEGENKPRKPKKRGGHILANVLCVIIALFILFVCGWLFYMAVTSPVQ